MARLSTELAEGQICWHRFANKQRESAAMKVLGLNRVELLVNDPDAAQATFEKLFNGGHFAADDAIHGRAQDCRVNYPHGLELVHPMDARHLPGQLLEQKGEHIFCVVWDVDSIDAARAHVLAEGFAIRYEGDYSAKPEVEVHKQLVVDPAKTHGMMVIFQERRLMPGREEPRATRPGLEVLGLQRAELLVSDANGAEETYRRLFAGQLDFERDIDAASRPLDCRVDWKLGLELVHPTSGEDKIGKLLADKGEHVFTVVWDVNDFELARQHVLANGFEIQWEHDFGPHGPLAVHKQMVVRPTNTHGLQVIFQERAMVPS
jgi:catechol 2,3-dioxygenase-like lactoylglutathione lyase family enzyme